MFPLGAVLTAVSPGLGDTLSYLMLGIFAMFLLVGPIITYIYYKKNKRETAAVAPSSA